MNERSRSLRGDDSIHHRLDWTLHDVDRERKTEKFLKNVIKTFEFDSLILAVVCGSTVCCVLGEILVKINHVLIKKVSTKYRKQHTKKSL